MYDLLEQLNQRQRLRRTSADSQATPVSVYVIEANGAEINVPDSETYFHVVTSREASTCMAGDSPNISIQTTISGFLEHAIPSPDSETSATSNEHALRGREARVRLLPSLCSFHTSHAIMGTMKSTRDKDCEESQMPVRSGIRVIAKNGPPSGSSRLKTWLKKKITPEHKPHQIEIVFDIDETLSPVRRQPCRSNVHQTSYPRSKTISLDAKMHPHIVVLITASQNIGTGRALSQAEQISQRVFASRASAIRMIQHLRSMHERPQSPSPPGTK
ncbi:hypothetical protein FIBSPDRAFT_935797 [Athelia psychrophila]|uniref:Uncharacterized protein n=1 Tax=Athelia psychrophila TaxID=1759441 RepID=A0A166D6R9_9AGAM|nr:hypothetical protein FIBSPDRAFT_935797 [Fibularhizoctonia sp. CBS 109695]